MNSMTFNNPTLGVDKIHRVVEFKFDKAFKEGARPVPGLGSRDANKGDRIGMEEELQAMLIRILHVPRL